MSEDWDDQVARLKLLASGDRDCDLSDNDRAAIQSALDHWDTAVDIHGRAFKRWEAEKAELHQRLDRMALDNRDLHSHCSSISSGRMAYEVRVEKEKAELLARAERAEHDTVELAKLAMETCGDSGLHVGDHNPPDCDFCGPWRERVAAIEDLLRPLPKGEPKDTSPPPLSPACIALGCKPGLHERECTNPPPSEEGPGF